MVRRLAGQGITVVLSSHLLAEVEDLCNRVAIVRMGRMVYEGHLSELRRTAGSGYRLRTTDDDLAERVCRAQPGIAGVRRVGAELAFTGDERAVGELSVALVEAGAAILALTPEHATLEELFFRLTEGDQATNGGEPALTPAREVAQ
jgi:ABC-2 type transport system ATP-binding protein